MPYKSAMQGCLIEKQMPGSKKNKRASNAQYFFKPGIAGFAYGQAGAGA